jgi:hypothetical protein
MSDVFDPEKVERTNPAGLAGMKRVFEGRWVLASDYDQLLNLYHQLQSYCDTVEGLPQNLWSRRRYESAAARQKAEVANRAVRRPENGHD